MSKRPQRPEGHAFVASTVPAGGWAANSPGRTVMQKFQVLEFYERHHHVPECEFQDLSYCIDCHSEVCNISAWLRGQGLNKYPSDMVPL